MTVRMCQCSLHYRPVAGGPCSCQCPDHEVPFLPPLDRMTTPPPPDALADAGAELARVRAEATEETRCAN